MRKFTFQWIYCLSFDKPSENIPTILLIYSQMPRIMNDPFAFVQSWKIFHKVTQWRQHLKITSRVVQSAEVL